MNTENSTPTSSPAKSQTQIGPVPAFTDASSARPETSAPGISSTLRDAISEAERAEEIRRERERAAMRPPVGLD